MILEYIKNHFFPELPVLKEMPAHVRDLKLDPRALLMHMIHAERPNPSVNTGYTKPTKDAKS